VTARIFIDGAAGTTGLEIRERLTGRADLALMTLDEQQRKSASARRDALNAADIAILCLPDEAAREAVTLIDNPHTRVIDASTAHRVAPDWVFGFPEIIGYEAITNAARVSNPGCYSTGFIALVAPLVRADLIPRDWILSCNAVSGYSGGGKAMIAAYESSTPAPAWSGYALSLAHKHVPEMQLRSHLRHPPLFAPAVVNTYRGMVVDVPLMLAAMPNLPTVTAIQSALNTAYAGTKLVRVTSQPEATTMDISRAAGTDWIELSVYANASGTQVRLVAALDNLGKGAGGAAIQNMNIMLGLDEATGLRS
jgi:N-acetyl-gamma-glutamyl-phosphate reductase